jgi:nucleotide-binding universal stress UspA family protein
MATRHVVVGVDGSVIAVRALDLAADEAALRATTLEIVYAVPDLDVAGPVLASSVSRVAHRHPRLPVVAVPVEGHSAAVLAERGREAALTVVGCRNLGGFAGTVFGSVSRRLAAHAHGPLLVVRGDSPPHLHNEVLLVLDDENDVDTAAYAFQETELRSALLRILRSSTQTLLETTRTADLVVLPCGASGQLGSMARMLLHRAHCPVLVVPGPGGSGSPRRSVRGESTHGV